MSDLKDLGRDASTKAALAAGKDAAKRALDDLLLSDEEKEKRSLAEKQAARRRRWKYVAIGVVSLLLLAGLVGLVMAYWQWFLAAGILGLAGLLGYYQLRRKLRAKRAAKEEANAEAEKAEKTEAKERKRVEKSSPPPKAAAKPEPVRVASTDQSVEEIRRRTAELRAAREAREAAEAAAVDEELAAIKARLKK
ncbi:MAG: hypothetical protein U0271_28365 [Polyangiaceae bacterium]